jgi:hypothetical protein
LWPCPTATPCTYGLFTKAAISLALTVHESTLRRVLMDYSGKPPSHSHSRCTKAHCTVCVWTVKRIVAMSDGNCCGNASWSRCAIRIGHDARVSTTHRCLDRQPFSRCRLRVGESVAACWYQQRCHYVSLARASSLSLYLSCSVFRWAYDPTRRRTKVSFPRNVERNVSKFAQHKVLKLMTSGKLTFEERVALYRVA